MPMRMPCRDTVSRVLLVNDRDLKIRNAIEQAWADIQAKYPDMAWWRRLSTVRAVMWEHSVDRVMEVVGDDEGLRAVEHHDTASFIADDTVQFRLKKADSGLLSSNYPTALARLFHSHESPTDLFGHAGYHRVEIAHVFNRFRTGIDRISVVARQGRKVIWDFELRRRESGTVVAFPSTPTLPAGKTVLRPTLPEVPGKADVSE